MEELRAFVRNEKVFSRKVQNLYLSRMESAANEAAEAGEEFSDQKVGTAFWKEFRSTIPEYENVKKLQNILGRQRMYWNATARRNLAPAGNDVAAIPTANDQLRQAEMESENLKKEIEDDEAIRLYLDELILRKKVALQQKMDLMEKLMREGDATWIERNVVRGNEPINPSPDENYNCVPPSLQELHKQGLAMPVLCKEKEPAMRTHRKNIDMVNVTPTGLSMNLESEGENLDEFADGDRLASQVQIVMTKENGQTPDFKWNQLDHLSLQHDFDFGTELRILGQGAFGFVVWAKKKDTNCPFAVKLMNLKTAQEKNMELHLLREIRIHSQLQHPNIVRLHHYFYDDPEVVLTLDFCERGTLSDAIKEGSLNQTQVAQMLLQLTSAVHYCHDLKGIFHRDIKTDNILLDGSGTIKLADFGFATRIKKNSPRLFSFCGTMAFLAPELAKKWESMGNVEYDEMVDVWAIGVVLFESLHGSLPFGGVDHIINVKQQGPPIRKDLNRFAKNLILQFLMYDPKKRIRLDQVKNHDWIQETLHNSKENIAPSRRSDECGNIYLGNAFR